MLCCNMAMTSPLRSDAQAARDVVIFKALANAVRLQIVSIVAGAPEGQVSAGHIVEQFELSQPTISHHLKVLRDAGVLTAHKTSTFVFYRFTPQVREAVSGLIPAQPVAAPPAQMPRPVRRSPTPRSVRRPPTSRPIRRPLPAPVDGHEMVGNGPDDGQAIDRAAAPPAAAERGDKPGKQADPATQAKTAAQAKQAKKGKKARPERPGKAHKAGKQAKRTKKHKKDGSGKARKAAKKKHGDVRWSHI